MSRWTPWSLGTVVALAACSGRGTNGGTSAQVDAASASSDADAAAGTTASTADDGGADGAISASDDSGMQVDGAPVPATRVLASADLPAALPPGTAMVDSSTRAATMARRRLAVRRRFPR